MGVGKAIVGIVAAILALSLFFTPMGHNFLNFILDPPSAYPESARYEMDRNISITLSNDNMSYAITIPRAEDYVVDGITLQKVYSQHSEKDYDEYMENGLNWVRWSGRGSGTHISTMEYDVECYTYVWDIDENKSLTTEFIQQNLYGNLSHLQAYLFSDSGDGSEWIPSSNASKGYVIYTGGEVKELASEIVGDETNVYTILKLIYDWIDSNIQYKEYGGVPQTARELLQSRNGDCDDQSVLFCSLARAVGVPAWLEMGALYNTSKGTWINHVWAQAFIPTIYGGSNVTVDVVNNKFLSHTSRMFHLATDSGDGDLLNRYYHMYHYTYRYVNSQVVVDDQYIVNYASDSAEKIMIYAPARKLDSPIFFLMQSDFALYY